MASRTSQRPLPPAVLGRSLLWQRDFQLLWFGETVSRFGSEATAVALPLVAISTLQASTFTIGVLHAAAWLPWLLISLPAGAWVDRFARRTVMLTCDVISAVLFFSIPVAAWTGWLSMPQLLAVAFCGGFVKVFFRTAYQAYLPSVVSSERLAEGNAKMQGSASAAEIAGPGIAGAMAQALGAVTAVLADAVSFLVSAACLLRIKAREVPNEDPRRTSGLIGRVGDGLRYVVRDPYLRTLALFGAVGNLTAIAVQALMVVFLVRDVGVGSGMAGLLMASLGAGGIVGALLTKNIIGRFGTARALLLCQACTAPFGLLLPLTDNGIRLTFFALGGVVLAAGVVAGSIISSSFRQSYCPTHLLGRVSAVVSFLVFGAMPIGALIGGAMGSALGVRNALWVLAGSLLLPVLVLVYSPISRRRDLPAKPPQPSVR